MSLSEDLHLDLTDALAGVDQLEARINQAATNAADVVSTALTAAISDATSVGQSVADSMTQGAADGARAVEEALDGATATVTVSVDTAQAQAQLDDVEGPQVEASVDVGDARAELDSLVADTPTDVQIDAVVNWDGDEAQEKLDGLVTQDGVVISTTVGVDTDQIDQARDALDGLVATAEQAAAAAPARLFEGDAGDIFGGGSGGGSTGAAVTGAAVAGGIGGLEEAASLLSPELAKVAAAGTAAGVGLGVAFDGAVEAESALFRLRAVLGDAAEDFLEFDGTIAGFTGTMQDLALATGSADDPLVVAAANFADLGKQSGYTNDEVARSGQELAVLASYVAATRPQLGSADQIIQRLGISLQRGGRFAQQMGLDIGNAGDITARAAQLFDKPKEQLTGYERSVAGLTIAYEKLGGSIGPAIAAATDNPEIALRALQARLGEVAETAGGRFLEPVVDTLEALAPVAENAADILSRVAEGGIKVLGAEAQALSSVLGVVADLLNNEVVGALVAASGGFLVARGSVSTLLQLVAKVSPDLAAIATRLNIGDGIAAQFSGLATATQQITQAFDAAEAAGTGFAVANENLTAVLAETLAEQRSMLGAMVEGSVTYEAASAAVAANTVLQERNQEVLSASAAVAEAAAEKQKLLVAAELGSADARSGLAQADETLEAAEVALAGARERQAQAAGVAAESVDELVDVMGSQGQAVRVASDAAAEAGDTLTDATAATSGLAGASTALNPILLGLAAAAAVAVGALILFSDSDVTAETVAATRAIRDYADALDYTSGQLANSSQSGLRERFQQEKDAADQVREAVLALSEEATLALDRVGAFREAGAAVRGDEGAQQRTRAAFVRSGEASIGLNTASDVDTELEQVTRDLGPEMGRRLRDDVQAAVEAAWVATGSEEAAQEAGLKAARAYGVEISTIPLYVDKRGSYQVFEDLVEGQREAERAALEAARAELEVGDATQTSNIAYLASIGLLGRLNPAEREHARLLLEEADAAERASENEAILAGIQDRRLRRLAAGALSGQSTLLAGGDPGGLDVMASRALVASDGFADLDQSVQDAANAVVEYADNAITAANQSGELFAVTGELAIGMGDLTDRLDQAAQSFVNILSAQQALGSSTRSLNNLLDDLVPTAGELGTTLDENAAAFDLSSINADNYQQYLSLLPRAVQDAIEGRNQAVEKAERDLEENRRTRPLDEGLLAERFAAGEFADGLASGGRDAAQERAEKSAEQKAAEVRAAIAGNQEALDKLSHTARDNARELADMFDKVGVAIRQEAAEMLKAGATTEEVTARIRERRDELIAAAEAAGFTSDQINEVLEQQRLLPTQVIIDLKESGVDKIVGAIERLATVMAGLDTIAPSVANAIRGIEDPTRQVEAFNEAIASLPEEQQTKLRLIYDVPDPEAFKAEQERKLQGGKPFEFAIAMGLDRESALRIDQEVADVIAQLPATAPIRITPEVTAGIAEFDQAISAEADRAWSIVLDPKASPESKAQAEADLRKLSEERDALIKATVSPESVNATELELAQAALERTVVFKTAVDPETGRTTAETLASLVPSGREAGVPQQSREELAQQAAQEYDAAVAGTVKQLRETLRRSGKDSPEGRRAQRELDDIAAARDALIKAQVEPGSLSQVEAELARWAQEHTVHFKTVVDPVENAPGVRTTEDQLGGLTQRQKDVLAQFDANAAVQESIARNQRVVDDANSTRAERDRAQRRLDNIAAQRQALLKAAVDPGSLTETERKLVEVAQTRTATVLIKPVVEPAAPLDGSDRPPSTGRRRTAGDTGEAAAAQAGRRAREAVARVLGREREATYEAKVDGESRRKADKELDDVAKPRTARIDARVGPGAKREAEADLRDTAKERKARIDPQTVDASRRVVERELRDVAKERKARVKPEARDGDLSEVSNVLARWARGIVLRIRTVAEAPTQLPAGTSPVGGGGGGSAGRSGGSTPSRSTPTVDTDDVVADVRSATRSLPIRDYTAAERRQGLPSDVIRWTNSGQRSTIISAIRRREARFPGFAQGGTTLTDDEVERLRRSVLGSDGATIAAQGLPGALGLAPLLPGAVAPLPANQPGLRTVFGVAEASAQGEYIISRDPQYRDRNQDVVRLAAADLGVGLTGPPPVPASVVVDRPTVDRPTVGGSDLVAAVDALAGAARTLADAGSTQTGPPQLVVKNEILVDGGSSERSSRATIADVRTRVVTGQ